MLTFRPYKNCDAESIATWITDEKMFYQWSADIIGKYPMTPEHLNEHYVLIISRFFCTENAL